MKLVHTEQLYFRVFISFTHKSFVLNIVKNWDGGLHFQENLVEFTWNDPRATFNSNKLGSWIPWTYAQVILWGLLFQINSHSWDDVVVNYVDVSLEVRIHYWILDNKRNFTFL